MNWAPPARALSSQAVPQAGQLMLSNQQFDRTRRLALSLAGIQLHDRHRELLHRRSGRLGIRDSAGLDSLLGAAEQGEAGAAQRLVGLLTTKFTGFFRHPRHFEIAAAHALQAVRRRGHARLWSAAAATGEEPWSLAMVVGEVFQCSESPPRPVVAQVSKPAVSPISKSAGFSQGVAGAGLETRDTAGLETCATPSADAIPVTILATDIDEHALAVAQRGEYGDAALRVLSTSRRAAWLAGGAAGKAAVLPALRRLVEFRVLNLARAAWPVTGPMDVIFCRNVLMYLENGHRQAVLERMSALLAPEGLLILDPAEYPGGAARLFSAGTDGVFQLRHDADRSARRQDAVREFQL